MINNQLDILNIRRGKGGEGKIIILPRYNRVKKLLKKKELHLLAFVGQVLLEEYLR